MFKNSNLVGFGNRQVPVSAEWEDYDGSHNGAEVPSSIAHIGAFYQADMILLRDTVALTAAVTSFGPNITIAVQVSTIDTSTGITNIASTSFAVTGVLDIASAGTIKLVRLTDDRAVLVYSYTTTGTDWTLRAKVVSLTPAAPASPTGLSLGSEQILIAATAANSRFLFALAEMERGRFALSYTQKTLSGIRAFVVAAVVREEINGALSIAGGDITTVSTRFDFGLPAISGHFQILPTSETHHMETVYGATRETVLTIPFEASGNAATFTPQSFGNKQVKLSKLQEISRGLIGFDHSAIAQTRSTADIPDFFRRSIVVSSIDSSRTARGRFPAGGQRQVAIIGETLVEDSSAPGFVEGTPNAVDPGLRSIKGISTESFARNETDGGASVVVVEDARIAMVGRALSDDAAGSVQVQMFIDLGRTSDSLTVKSTITTLRTPYTKAEIVKTPIVLHQLSKTRVLAMYRNPTTDNVIHRVLRSLSAP